MSEYVWGYRVFGVNKGGGHVANIVLSAQREPDDRRFADEIEDAHDALLALPDVNLVETAGPFRVRRA